MLKKLKTLKQVAINCFICLLIVLPLMAQSTNENKLPDMDSENSRALKLFDDGKALLDQDQLEKAVIKFEQAIKVDYNYVRAHFRYMGHDENSGP